MERPRPGTYLDGLPEYLYHNKEHGYSSSNLKDLLKSNPEKLKWKMAQQTEPSEAMKIGTVLHCHLLRPEDFENEIAVMPSFNLRKKADKADKAIWELTNVDKQTVTKKELELGLSMANAVRENHEAMKLLDGAIKERSMYADIMGTPLRARPDAYKENILLEVKSTRDASEKEFAKQIANLYYHVSLVHYAHVMEECAPEKLTFEEIDYRFIVVENTPPHSVAIYTPSERMIYVGNELWKEALEKLQSCLENDIWPGYTEPGTSEEIDLPNWAVPKEEE